MGAGISPPYDGQVWSFRRHHAKSGTSSAPPLNDYALMDRSETIDLPHLKAALALWDYSEQSVKMIFEEMTGDENVDLVVKCGKAFKSITRSQLWTLLGHNNNKHELDRIGTVLAARKLAIIDPQQTLIFK